VAKRRGGLSGFASGFAGGVSIGNSIRGVMNESDLAKESESLNKKMDDSTTFKAKEEGGGALSMPDRQTAENYAAYNNEIAAEDEATFGGGLSSAPKTTVDKAQTYTRADYYADMGRKASGLGMPDRAERYQARSEDVRDKEFQRGRLEKSDQRADESHALNMEKGQIDLGRAKAEEEGRKRLEAFNTQLSSEYEAAMKAGKPLSMSRVKELALENKLGPQQIVSAYAGLNGIDEAETASIIAARARAAKDAAGGGLDNMVQVYETNPLFNDGLKLEIKRDKAGKVSLLNNGQKIVSDVSEQHAMGYLLRYVSDPMSAIEFDMQVRSNLLKDRKTQSEIDENRAQQANALAGAAKTKAETAALKDGGGQKPADVRQNVGAAVKQVLLATGLAKQDQTGNLFMQALDGKSDGNSEQEIARISAQAEELVRQGMPPYKAAEQVIQGRKAPAPAPNPDRKPLSHFAN